MRELGRLLLNAVRQDFGTGEFGLLGLLCLVHVRLRPVSGLTERTLAQMWEQRKPFPGCPMNVGQSTFGSRRRQFPRRYAANKGGDMDFGKTQRLQALLESTDSPRMRDGAELRLLYRVTLGLLTWSLVATTALVISLVAR